MKSIRLSIKTFLLLLSILIVSCQTVTSKPIVVHQKLEDDSKLSIEIDKKIPSLDSVKLNINFKPKGNYTSVTTNVINDRAYFKRLYQTNSTKAIDTASRYLYSKLPGIGAY